MGKYRSRDTPGFVENRRKWPILADFGQLLGCVLGNKQQLKLHGTVEGGRMMPLLLPGFKHKELYTHPKTNF